MMQAPSPLLARLRIADCPRRKKRSRKTKRKRSREKNKPSPWGLCAPRPRAPLAAAGVRGNDNNPLLKLHHNDKKILARNPLDKIPIAGACAKRPLQLNLPRTGTADFQLAIEEALANTRSIILVATDAAHLEGGWVRAEWTTFLNEQRAERNSGNLITVRPKSFADSASHGADVSVGGNPEYDPLEVDPN